MEDNQNKSGRVVVKKARGKQNLTPLTKFVWFLILLTLVTNYIESITSKT